MNNDKMLGRKSDNGVGGWRCPCCSDAPKHRDRNRRTIKRRERQAFRRDLSNM